MSPADLVVKGAVISVVGNLATMSRAEATRLIREAGGRLVEGLDPEAAVVVLGHGELPLSADGRPGLDAERVRGQGPAGQPLRVLTELELLATLGLAERAEELGQLYTTEQLGRILDLDVARIRSWVRSGLIRPVRVFKRLAWFDFRQVMAARALARLVDGGVPPQRIRRSLEEIATWHPAARDVLIQLETLTAGGLGVRLPGGAVASPSGQLLFEFRERAKGDEGPGRSERAHLRVFDPRVLADTGGSETDAERWFRAGLEAEDQGDLEAADHAYTRSVEVGGPQPETLFNLGNVRYRAGELVEAAQTFLHALETDPEYVECWNNLGNALAGLRRTDDAIRSYRRALEIEPRYADAHANLAQALEARGRPSEARQHWLQYVGAEPQGERAARVRRMLGIVHGKGAEDA